MRRRARRCSGGCTVATTARRRGRRTRRARGAQAGRWPLRVVRPPPARPAVPSPHVRPGGAGARERLPRALPAVPSPAALEEGPVSVVRLSVDSQSCATPHCSRESVWASGPYAGLCNVCAATSRHRRARAAATRMTMDERRAQRREGAARSRGSRDPRVRLRGARRVRRPGAGRADLLRAARGRCDRCDGMGDERWVSMRLHAGSGRGWIGAATSGTRPSSTPAAPSRASSRATWTRSSAASPGSTRPSRRRCASSRAAWSAR